MRALVAIAGLMLAATPTHVAAGSGTNTASSFPDMHGFQVSPTGVQARCTPAFSWNRTAQHMQSISGW